MARRKTSAYLRKNLFSTALQPLFIVLLIFMLHTWTHSEPYRTTITQADAAFSGAGSYLCIGYGFNDEHIQPKLLNEIKKGKAIVVLAKKMTEACKKHLVDAGMKKYIIFESAGNGKTAVHSSKGNERYDGEFWSLDKFIEKW